MNIDKQLKIAKFKYGAVLIGTGIILTYGIYKIFKKPDVRLMNGRTITEYNKSRIK